MFHVLCSMIGVFDSGVGGLSVVKQLFRYLPQYQIIYFGDTARCPYGSKGDNVIRQYARENAQFLINRGAKIIIIACNTASAVALDILKKEFTIPIFGVIEAAAQYAVAVSKNKKIGVIGTRATINSGIYEKRIRDLADYKIAVYSQACSLLVPLVEEGWGNYLETKLAVERYLKPLKSKNIDTLILGCTHYPFIKNLIKREIGENTRLVDSGKELVLSLKKFLDDNREMKSELTRGQKHQFFVSDLTSNLAVITKKWFNKDINWKVVSEK